MEERNRKLNSLLMPLNEFQAWADAHGHNMLPIIQQSKRAAAAQLCLQEPWEWRRQDSGSFADFADPSQRGSNLISWLLFFQKYQQCSFCCFKFWRFTHDDAAPHHAHLRGGFLPCWVRWGGEPKPVAVTEYLQAASPLFLCPRILLS